MKSMRTDRNGIITQICLNEVCRSGPALPL